MGRPRKADSSQLISIVDEYFKEEVCGDPGKLMFNRIAQYATRNGYDFAGYHFRRDEEVRKHIDELKESLHDSLKDKGIVAYKSLDVEGIIKQCHSLDELIKHLYEIDAYWKKAYLELADVSDKYNRLLQEREKDRAEVRKYRKLAQENEAGLADTKKELNAEKRQNVYLRGYIRENVYPEIAHQILREHHIQTDDNKIVRPETFNKLIEGKRPLPFDGEQVKTETRKSATDRLIEELERQVDSYE